MSPGILLEIELHCFKRGVPLTYFAEYIKFEFEFIDVLRHMQRYFSHICDVTDVQVDWRSYTYGRSPNAIDISQGY